ncbi:hypothetical protein ACIPC1_34990 [Streptomyces sp. NPDC087263]|uniref:hypothetical protein n=1 Tax=Streptomyces sp. NPDC087263 TaxID=3365773 RepID=UPI003813C50B
MLGRSVADALADELSAAGRLVPFVIDGNESSESDDYFVYLVERIVDCLDTRRSSKPKKTTGEITKAVFFPDALPAELPAFRVPQYCGGVYWNGWAVDCLAELLGDDIEARLVWSEDPSLTPHPNLWGF